MKQFLKLVIKYWLYNQWFFLCCIVAFMFADFIGEIALIKFHRTYNVNNNPFIYYSFFIFQLICILIAFYKPFKAFWYETINNYKDNLKSLITASCTPFILTSIFFIIYLTNFSINNFTVWLMPLAFLHGSILFYYLKFVLYFDNFILSFFMINFTAWAFFAYLVYSIKIQIKR